MTNFEKIPTWANGKHVHAVVETPRGSQGKFKFDPKLKAFTLSKPLLVGLTYPYDWGFVPGTKAADGDALDALIIHKAATFPGLVLTCRVIGVLEVEQRTKKRQERNDRLFLVPAQSDFEAEIEDVRSLSKHTVHELEKFFEATDALDDKRLKFLGWRGPKAALNLIKQSGV